MKVRFINMDFPVFKSEMEKISFEECASNSSKIILEIYTRETTDC